MKQTIKGDNPIDIQRAFTELDQPLRLGLSQGKIELKKVLEGSGVRHSDRSSPSVPVDTGRLRRSLKTLPVYDVSRLKFESGVQADVPYANKLIDQNGYRFDDLAIDEVLPIIIKQAVDEIHDHFKGR